MDSEGDPGGAVPPRLADLRVSYDMGTLTEGDLAPSPLEQFRHWLAAAVAAGVDEPNAMVLATATADGVPSARTVLLKEADPRGFAFYTNLGSRKGRELAGNPRASCVIGWLALHRQVVIAGDVEPVPRDEARRYFDSRPLSSRWGAWASRQSEPIPGREVLDERLADIARRYPVDVPLPEFWGGWILRPVTVEFWQGRESRLHDRLRYRRPAPGARLDEPWPVERLSP